MATSLECLKEHHRKALEAYREDPNRSSNSVAMVVGCDPKTAAKALNDGWPKHGLEPIKAILSRELEQTVSTALAPVAPPMPEELTGESEVIGTGASHARKVLDQETTLVSMARGRVVGLLRTSARAAALVDKIVDLLEKRIEAEGETMAPLDLVAVLKAAADQPAKASRALREVVEVERLVAGEPTQIIGLASKQGTGRGDLTLPDAHRLTASAWEAVKEVEDATVRAATGEEPELIGKRVQLGALGLAVDGNG